jgi:hypothetical protein
VCHALLEDPKFHSLLLRIDQELAEQTRADGCRCGGNLHRADYPRKPRGCPRQATAAAFVAAELLLQRSAASARPRCRCASWAGACTGLAVVLVSARQPGRHQRRRAAVGARRCRAHAAALARWWREQFPQTPLWQAACARFMPPVSAQQLPGELLERFAGEAHEALHAPAAFWLSR